MGPFLLLLFYNDEEEDDGDDGGGSYSRTLLERWQYPRIHHDNGSTNQLQLVLSKVSDHCDGLFSGTKKLKAETYDNDIMPSTIPNGWDMMSTRGWTICTGSTSSLFEASLSQKGNQGGVSPLEGVKQPIGKERRSREAFYRTPSTTAVGYPMMPDFSSNLLGCKTNIYTDGEGSSSVQEKPKPANARPRRFRPTKIRHLAERESIYGSNSHRFSAGSTIELVVVGIVDSRQLHSPT
ncbi:hypothetical protein TgHK011_006384 [Trichoderma gracile]|nr:hypothetical protein TgHK011_006384 [Trichoderma gracile]